MKLKFDLKEAIQNLSDTKEFQCDSSLGFFLIKLFNELELKFPFFVKDFSICFGEKNQYLGKSLNEVFIGNLDKFLSNIHPKYIINTDSFKVFKVESIDNNDYIVSTKEGGEISTYTITEEQLKDLEVLIYE